MPRKKKSERAVAAPKPQRIALWKKLVFAAITCVVFFAAAELALWAAGVSTLIEQDDPFRGFSGLVTVFERDGDVYQTRRATLKSTFNDQSFLAQKPANGLRLFCLGGSSSYGFPWGADAAFTAILGETLAASHPELRVEAVNASGISYAMHRLNIVADELLKYKPDVFIIYSGHNEFVESAFFEALKYRGAVRTRVEYALAHSRVYSGMQTILARGADAKPSPAEDFDAKVRRDTTRAFSHKEKAGIVAEYQRRLLRLVRIAQENGVKVMLATVPCNLREWRPEASGGMATLSEEDRQAWLDAFGSGKRRLDAKEWEAAKTNFERAARLAPGHAETLFLLGKAYEALARWDDARGAFQRACDADASPTRRVSGINDAIREVARQRGVLLVDVDRIFEELSAPRPVGFNLIEDYVHPTQEGHEIIAWHMWDTMERAGWLGGKAPAERAVFDRVIAERQTRPKPKNAAWPYNQGVVLENQGHFKAAIKKYRESVAISEHVGALSNLGGLLQQTGQAAEAVGILERAIKTDPKHVAAHNNLGLALQSLGRSAEALAQYEETLRLNPKHTGALVNLGIALQRLGRAEEAVAHYEQALRQNPNSPDIHNNLGLALEQLGRLDEATKQYKEALRLKPGSPEAHNNLGLVLQGKGHTKDAVAHYETALRINPNFTKVHNNLANALHETGRLEEAVEHYREALRLDPNYAEVHSNLGVAMQRLGNTDAAIRHYRKALRLKPGLGRTRANLVRLLTKLGRFREAEEHKR